MTAFSACVFSSYFKFESMAFVKFSGRFPNLGLSAFSETTLPNLSLRVLEPPRVLEPLRPNFCNKKQI